MGYRVSAHLGGGKAHREHNVRNPQVVKKQDHIDPSGVHENWLDETEMHAYNRLFGESIQRFNDKQTRLDRMTSVRKYYKQIEESSKQHTSYEFIISIGKKGNEPPKEDAKEILHDFFEKWKEFYPSLELIGCYYHADEEGVGHIHVDFIPIGRGYSKGMDVRNGLNQALKELGFRLKTETRTLDDGKTKRVKVTPQQQLQDDVRDRVIEIGRSHGLDIEDPRHGTGDKHQEIWDYKEAMDDAEKKGAEIIDRADRTAVERVAEGESQRAKLIREGEEQKEKLISSGREEYDEYYRMAQEWEKASSGYQSEAARLRKEAAEAKDMLQWYTEQSKNAMAEATAAAQRQLDATVSEEAAKNKAEQAKKEAQDAQKERDEIIAQSEAKKANLDNLSALEQAKGRIEKILGSMADTLERKVGWKPTIYSQTPEKKDWHGNIKAPALVEIRETDLDRLLESEAAKERYDSFMKQLPELKKATAEALSVVNLDEQIQEIQEQSEFDLSQAEQQIQALSRKVKDLEEREEKWQKWSKQQQEQIDAYSVYDVLEDRIPNRMQALREVIDAESAMRNAKNVSDPFWRQRMGSKVDGCAQWHDFMSDGTSTALIYWGDNGKYRPHQFAGFYKSLCEEYDVPVAPDLVDYVGDQIDYHDRLQHQQQHPTHTRHR